MPVEPYTIPNSRAQVKIVGSLSRNKYAKEKTRQFRVKNGKTGQVRFRNETEAAK
jgi:hypothetical protein